MCIEAAFGAVVAQDPFHGEAGDKWLVPAFYCNVLGEAFTFLRLTAHGELWYIDWQLVWVIPVVCVTAETYLMMDRFMVTVAVISSIKPFRWICFYSQKSLVVQKWLAFWCDFLTSLTKVKRALDIAQAANSKTSLSFMNQCWLCNVVTVPPGFAPQYCLHMLLLFVVP